MKPERIFILGFLGLLIGGGYGYVEKTWFESTETTRQEVGDYVTSIPDFTYHDLKGHQRWSTEWTQNIMVLNFWATWCPPCRKEIPAFIKLQDEFKKQNVVFVGIAIDTKEAVTEFAEEYKINYPTLIGDMAASELSRKMGNRTNGLPFTVISNSKGEILFSKAGEIHEESLREILSNLVEEGS